MQKKVAVIMGTRPEAIKLIPVYKALCESPRFQPVLISTGQHKEMLQNIFELFDIVPDYELDVMRANQTLASLTSRLFSSIGDLLEKIHVELVLVQGDTTTAFVGAVVSHYQQIKVGHVEAGLRTGNKWAPFPEESNRRMVGVVADFHFTPTKTATKALYLEGINNGVYEVGNTVIDSLTSIKAYISQKIDYYDSLYQYLPTSEASVILVTGHRRESFGQGFESICAALARIAEEYPDKYIIYPVHLNPNINKIVKELLKRFLNIKLIDPVPYDEMIYLMNRSWLIMTDSGGIQEEAPSLDIPVIVMRETTERQEGVDAGCSVLCGLDAERIFEQFEKIANTDSIYDKMARSNNPYGDGNSAKKIVSIISKMIG